MVSWAFGAIRLIQRRDGKPANLLEIMWKNVEVRNAINIEDSRLGQNQEEIVKHGVQ